MLQLQQEDINNEGDDDDGILTEYNVLRTVSWQKDAQNDINHRDDVDIGTGLTDNLDLVK